MTSDESCLSTIFWRKIRQEMRIEFLAERKPKSKLRLTPKQPQDLNIDLQKVSAWSIDNCQLYQLLLQNGFAQFLCNKEYLYQHYQSLFLIQVGLTQLDTDCLRFLNLKYLKLNNNSISVLCNVPANCVEFYANNNLISDIRLQSKTKLQLLAVANNSIGDEQFKKLVSVCPELRALDISYNSLCKMQSTVQTLKALQRLRILSLYGNPISLLKHYYKVVTQKLVLNFIDEGKYVKPEKKKPPPTLPPVAQQKKEQKKDDKKDAKKDPKKDGKKETKKEQQAPPPPVVQSVVEEVIMDLETSTISFALTVLQNCRGVLLDSTLYPEFSKNPAKYQTSYWLQYEGIDGVVNTSQRRILQQSAVTQQQKSRITFNETFEKQFHPSVELRNYIAKGSRITIWKQEPCLKAQGDSEEKKPQMKDGIPVTKRSVVGVLKLQLSQLLREKTKKLEYKCRIFPISSADQCNFHFPLQDENALIQKNRKKIEADIQKQKQELKKQQQAQEAAKALKKGGKDTKKPPPVPDKKQGKKGGKQQPEDKKAIPIPEYPIYPRQFIYIDDDHIIRANPEMLSVSIHIK